MQLFAAILREARETAGLDIDTLAGILELSPELIAGYEADVDPPTEVLDRYATTFGTPLEAFLEGAATRSPATLLFRSSTDHGADLGNLLQSGDLRVLGDFLVCTTHVAELERQLDNEHNLPRTRAPDVSERAQDQGRDLALEIRAELDLGVEPIDSMISLLHERLGVCLFFVDPEQLHGSVQGASTFEPRPAILVNLIHGPSAWWATRVSLAHELCHLLFDFRGRRHSYLVSPPGTATNQWQIVERFQAIERRANAFAVHFLAPGEGIRRMLGQRSPASEEAIGDVCRHFGVGRTVAVRRLGHEFQLSESWQRRHIERSLETKKHALQHPDANVAIGLRAGDLRTLVKQGLERGIIDSVEARAILRTPLHEPLAIDRFLDPPVISEEKAASTKAIALLHARGMTSLGSTGAQRTEGGWTIELCCIDEHGELRKETIHLTHELEHVDARAI